MKKALAALCSLPLVLLPDVVIADDKNSLPLSSSASYSDLPAGISERSVRKIYRRAPSKKVPVKGSAGKVCKSTAPLTRALLKNAYPGHISLRDPRASGFAFVCGSDCPKKFPVNAYYSDGTLAFKLGYYGRWEGNGKPRAYCGTNGVAQCPVGGVIRASRVSGRDGKIYLDFGNGSCRTVTPGSRNGSTS